MRAVCLLAIATNSLGGCGTQVPDIVPVATSPRAAAFLVNRVANQVNCELRHAVRAVVAEYGADDDNLGWLTHWSAKVTYKIIVDEKAVLNPGLSFTTPYVNNIHKFSDGSTVTTPQSFSFGLGGALSSEATRTESVGFFFDFSNFFPVPAKEDCPYGQGSFIESDLKLLDWLEGVALTAETPGTLGKLKGAPISGAPYDTVTHEVQFVVTTGANATPTWKLVEVSANPTAPFLGATRVRTDDVLITMGAPASISPAGKATGPSQSMQDAHLAAQIGLAVGINVQSHP